MAFRMMAEGVVEGAVAVAALLWNDVSLSPKSGARMLVIHGTDDTLYPAAGGATTICDGSDSRVPYVYGGTVCSQAVTLSTLQAAGITASLDSVEGGGHQWFSGKETDIVNFLFP